MKTIRRNEMKYSMGAQIFDQYGYNSSMALVKMNQNLGLKSIKFYRLIRHQFNF